MDMNTTRQPAALLVAILLLAGCSGTEPVVPSMQAQADPDPWLTLFDGTSLDGWTQAGPGDFVLEPDGTMRSRGGMGLFYYAEQPFRDYVLEVDWKVGKHTANSGVFLRFPETTDPWVAVNQGYEIQIDNSRDPDHVTGSVYSFSAPFQVTANPTEAWNTYRIKVTGQRYEVWLNEEKINDFIGDRSREGYIGLQNHDDSSKVWFRNIRVKPLPENTPAPESLAEMVAVDEEREPIRVLMMTATHGFRHGPAIAAQKEIMTALSQTTEFRVDTTEDLTHLNPENLARYDLLFFANATLRAPAPEGAATASNAGAAGTFANYDVEIQVPNNAMGGKLALSGDADALTGTILFDAFPDPSPLADVMLDGNALSFNWDGGQFGTIEAALTLDGDALSGQISAGGNQIPMTGARSDAEEAASSEKAWTLDITTPQGLVEAVLTLFGEQEDGGQIAFPEGTAPLQDLALDGPAIRFNFEGGQLGNIAAGAETDGDTIAGNFTVGGAPVPFTGSAVTAREEQETEGPRITPEQQAAIMDFLRAGKGIAVAHAGLDALYNWDAYRAMVGGGLFESHPWTQSVRIAIEEPDNPAVQHFGDGFWIRDEIYVLDENPRWNARVLASLDMESVGIEQGPADAGRNDYPISWIRNHNGGRVFATKLGHFADVWKTPAFLKHLLQGMRMAAGRLEADFSGHRVKETIAENVWPDDIAIDDRGNVWIAELRGKIHHYNAETGEVCQIAHLPTTDPTKIEHGLYGIEVDPNFYDGEPYIYLYYAERETIINTLSRFEYRDGQLDLTTEHVLLRVPTEPQCCHQAGDIEWGPDGTLYLSTGDTGMSETRPAWKLSEVQLDAFKARHNLKDYHWSRLVDSERSAQNLQDLRGKILRINKDGTIPKDNPFFGEAGIRWEIYAYGLRNPYRFKVDHQTGALYIGVVGPDASFDYDEYNISEKGGENFGWPRTLGRLFYNEWTPEMIPNYVPPLWEYTYETGGRSATVGPIYRHEGPGAFPKAIQNKVFLFDWSRRWIKYADVKETGFVNDVEADVRNVPLKANMRTKRLVNIKTFDTLRRTAPISMEQGPDGSLYLAEFDGFWDAGPNAKVTRYRWVEGNQDPMGDASFRPSDDDPRRVQFDGSRSYDPNADPLTYHWDFGDGTTSSEPNPLHRYSKDGSYTARLTVTDTHGMASKPVSLEVVVGAAVPEAGDER